MNPQGGLLIRRSLLLGVVFFSLLSCTSTTPKSEQARKTASAEADPVAAMCAQDPVSSLYESLIAATCTVNYAWELIGGGPTDDAMFNCAALYMGGGGVAAVAGGAAQARLQTWSKNLQGERTILVRNTVLNRRDIGILMENPFPVKVSSSTEVRFGALQRQYEYWGNLKNDFAQAVGRGGERIERVLAKYPHHYVRYHYLKEVGDLDGSSLAVTKGPHRVALESSRWALRLGLLSTGIGVAMIATDTILGSTATACDEHVHAFYEANRDDYCRPVKVAGPNVIRFLRSEPEEQMENLRRYPQLCRIYGDIAQSQFSENSRKFGTREISYFCVQGGTRVELVSDSGVKSEIQLSGLKARMHGHANVTDVEYRRNGDRIEIAAIIWRSQYGGMRPLKYRFPQDFEKVGETRFQNIYQQVARDTLALEAADLFNSSCR